MLRLHPNRSNRRTKSRETRERGIVFTKAGSRHSHWRDQTFNLFARVAKRELPQADESLGCSRFEGVLVDTGTHTRARKSSIVRRKKPRIPSVSHPTPKQSSLFLLHPFLVCRSSRPVNELQGCKSESWLNCLLSRVEPGFAPSSAFFLPLFSAVSPRGIATMFLHPPAHSNPLRLAVPRELGANHDQRKREMETLWGLSERSKRNDGEIGTFYYRFVSNFTRNRVRSSWTASTPIHRSLTRFAATVVHRCLDVTRAK